jgi:hypothetical protein
VTVGATPVIGPEKEEPSDVSQRNANRSGRHRGSLHQCFIPKPVCLRKKENCGNKGDAQ